MTPLFVKQSVKLLGHVNKIGSTTFWDHSLKKFNFICNFICLSVQSWFQPHLPYFLVLSGWKLSQNRRKYLRWRAGEVLIGAKYSRDMVCLSRNILKTVFHKIYLVHSKILCPNYCCNNLHVRSLQGSWLHLCVSKRFTCTRLCISENFPCLDEVYWEPCQDGAFYENS